MRIYRILLTLIAPLAALIVLLQVARRAQSMATLKARLALGPLPNLPAGAKTLWLHAASNGEVTSTRPLIEEALGRLDDIHFVITTNSQSAHDLVKTWGIDRLHCALAPFDLRFVTRRFLDRIAPSALIVIENELWPNRFALCAERGIPILVTGARMSERTFARYLSVGKFFGSTVSATLGTITRLAAQDAESEQRFLQLGLSPASLLPRMNLKSGVHLPPADQALLARLAREFERDKTVLAASTHDGEEPIVLEAFNKLRVTVPDARLILAPRHPARRASIEQALDTAGLPYCSRSRGQEPSSETPVYLADTLGEMAVWYQLAGLCFVGGSLTHRGGHTPFEPDQFGCVILHGPDVRNHALPYRSLFAKRAAIEVNNSDEMSAALSALMLEPSEAETKRVNAKAALDPLRVSGASYAAFWSALAELSEIPALHTGDQ